MSDQTEREARYVEAIWGPVVDHPMWIGSDGEGLEYLPEREARMGDFVYEAARAVIALDDQERAELRAQRDAANSRTLRMWERAKAAEEKLRAAEALADALAEHGFAGTSAQVNGRWARALRTALASPAESDAEDAK